MEKYFIVTNEAFLKRVEQDKENKKCRNDFIKKFFAENGIDGCGYYFGGSGRCNIAFGEHEKTTIGLHIDDTKANRDRFGKQFKKSRFENMAELRKNSEQLKSFQSACIEAGVVVNLWEIRPGDYFKELSLGGYASQRFLLNEKLYLRIRTDRYASITPNQDGFIEIKPSEYFVYLEQLEANNLQN